MSTTTEYEPDLTFRGGLWVRPMFELLDPTPVGAWEYADDAARWPEPFPGHDLYGDLYL